MTCRSRDWFDRPAPAIRRSDTIPRGSQRCSCELSAAGDRARGDAADAGHAWPLLSQRLGATVIVKHENHTPIGAFKVRGGLVYVDRLKRERPDTAGLISATRGNHGQSLAFAASRYGCR